MGLRGVVVGLGHMGAHHARLLSERPDLEVALQDPPRGLHAAPGHVDFAIIATPTTLHVEAAAPFLEAGIPCLVEKPLADSLEGAGLLASFPHCMPGHVERFNPALVHLPRGGVLFLQADRVAPPTGRSLDVDVVRDLMIHDLDLAALLLGDEISEIRAVGLGREGAGPDGCDIANARLETRSGRVATLTASRMARNAARMLRAFTADAYFHVDLARRLVLRIGRGQDPVEAETLPVAHRSPLEFEHDALLDAVRGRVPFPVRPEEGLAAVALTLELLRQMRLPASLEAAG